MLPTYIHSNQLDCLVLQSKCDAEKKRETETERKEDQPNMRVKSELNILKCEKNSKN